MITLRCEIRPQSPFATEFRGDVFFGHVCWAIRWLYGEKRLCELLEGYHAERPFLVVGDPLPPGYITRPALPMRLMSGQPNLSFSKELKKAPFLDIRAVAEPSVLWSDFLAAEPQGDHSQPLPLKTSFVRMHNSLSRETGTTGEGAMFAPRAQHAFRFRENAVLQAFILLDEARLGRDELQKSLEYVGTKGFGKRSSVGYGHFSVAPLTQAQLPSHSNPNAFLALSRVLPVEKSLNLRMSLYNTSTHFGRHGDLLAFGQVFKRPLLMMEAGAILVPADGIKRLAWLGSGAGGIHSPISSQLPETVHQGYAPVLPVQVAWEHLHGNS